MQKTREGRQDRQRQRIATSIPRPHLPDEETQAQGSKWLSPETSELVGREALLPLAMSLDGEKKER